MFSNDRSEGYCITFYKDNIKDSIVYWIGEAITSSDIMVITSSLANKDQSNNFDSDAFKNAMYYGRNDMEQAVDFVYSQIRIYFKNILNLPDNIKFVMHCSINELEHIANVLNDSDYDYEDLVTYEDKTEKIAVDLIVFDGNFNFRFSRIDNGEYENLSSIECNPNLSNNFELMSQMRDSLNKFIQEELEYQAEMNYKRI